MHIRGDHVWPIDPDGGRRARLPFHALSDGPSVPDGALVPRLVAATEPWAHEIADLLAEDTDADHDPDMDVFNLFAEQDWDPIHDRPGYRHGRTAIGGRLGATLLGGSLYEPPPDEKTWPYHYETGCEEWLIAIAGRPTLRGPDGERELIPGNVVVIPEGPEGSHQVINRSDDVCRVLILSSKSPVSIVNFPDSGKVALWTQADGHQAIFRTEPKLEYWGGES